MRQSRLPPAPVQPARRIKLRDYQQDAIAAILDSPTPRSLVALPTGTGKTIVFASLIANHPARTLILAHRDELLKQARDKLYMVDPNADVGMLMQGNLSNPDASTIIASVMTMTRPERLAEFAPDRFDRIIFDEAHHGIAASWKRIAEYFGVMNGKTTPAGPYDPEYFDVDHDAPATPAIGFTATPERGDGEALGQLFDQVVYQRSILDMIALGYLCDMRSLSVMIALDLGDVDVRRGDYQADSLAHVMEAANADDFILPAIHQHARNRNKIVAFLPTVDWAHRIADRANREGIGAVAVDGTMSAIERGRVLEQFEDDPNTRLIANVDVLTEGWDCPAVDCIVMAAPTKSRPRYIQKVGRGTRRFPGKADLLIIDMIGRGGRSDLITLNDIMDMDVRMLAEGESVVEALDRAAGGGRHDAVDVNGRMVVTWNQLFEQNGLAWSVIPGHPVYAMSLNNDATLTIEPQRDGTASVVRWHRGGRMDVIYANAPSMEDAIEIGEDYAREHAEPHLLNRAAGWRDGEPSDKQMNLVRRANRQGGKWPEPETRGEAADVLVHIFLSWWKRDFQRHQGKARR